MVYMLQSMGMFWGYTYMAVGCEIKLQFWKLNKVQFFSLEQKMFSVEDNLLPSHYMASSGLRKILTIIDLSTLGVSVLLYTYKL